MPTASAASESGFTEDERAAIKERAKELKTTARRGAKAAAAAEAEAADVLAKIAELPEADRALAQRVHEVITAAAPDLAPKLWYGQPAYARDGKVVCFFQPASKFKTRYSTLGFNESAALDDGAMWPTAFALLELTPAVESAITDLVKRAAG